MKVFISWSGSKSNTVATALRRWIPDVIQTVEPWMSRTDIEAGARWSREIDEKLGETKFGIICLTKSNLCAPWILFESGALAKTIADTFVCPYLIDLEPSDIPQGPLAQFQAKRANEKETWELISTINRALKEDALPEDKLKRTFDRWWPDLKHILDNLPAEKASGETRRSTEEMLSEVIDLVRALSRRSSREERRSLPHSSLTPMLSVLIERVGMRDGYQCKECGSTEDLELQHIIPLSKGGTHNLENLELICRNHRRGMAITATEVESGSA